MFFNIVLPGVRFSGEVHYYGGRRGAFKQDGFILLRFYITSPGPIKSIMKS